MPVEIRELSISTKIKSTDSTAPTLSVRELALIKKQVIEECLKVLTSTTRKSGLNR